MLNKKHVGLPLSRRAGEKRLHSLFIGMMALACVILPLSEAWSQEAQIIDLGANATPADVSNVNLVVGSRVGADNLRSAFVYDVATGVLNEIPTGILANAVNDTDDITGNTADSAFLYNGAYKDLGKDYTAYGINGAGLVAGSKSNDNPYRSVPRPTNPAVYNMDSGKWTELDIARVYPRGRRQGVYGDLYVLTDINDAGYGSGNYRKYGLTTAYGFVVTPAFNDVLRPGLVRANAVNNLKLVAGSRIFDPATDPYAHAAIYDIDAGTFTDLGTLNNGLSSDALDINEQNQVVGTSMTWDYLSSLVDPDKYHAFIWENGQMSDLNDLLPAGSGWILNSARAINERGVIVGTGWFNGAEHGFVLLLDGNVPPNPGPTPDPVAPEAVINADPRRGKSPLQVSFDGTGSYDSDGQIVSYEWDFGNGVKSTLPQTEYTYTVRGRYKASLKVTDNDGLTSTAKVRIRVR